MRTSATSVVAKRRERTPDISRVSSLDRIVLARKFMQTLDDHVYHELAGHAEERGVTIQGLIRAVIVPDWINSQVIRQRALTSSQSNASAGVSEKPPVSSEHNSLRNTLMFQR